MKKLKQSTLNDVEFKELVETEVDALDTIRDLNHPHLVKAVAYYTRGKGHYIVFPWARRGNLRDIWKTIPPKLDERLLEWFLIQCSGLAEAMKTLHHSHKDKLIRHGDLKPENILCFDDPAQQQSKELHTCVLTIADVGLSRSHDKVTELRKDATRTKSGTIMYEPPKQSCSQMNPDHADTMYGPWVAFT